MTEPTTIQVKAINPRPAAPKPERPVVSVRPVAALAANLAAAAGEAVVAVGGGMALAATAAGAAAIPLVASAARGKLRRPAMPAAVTRTGRAQRAARVAARREAGTGRGRTGGKTAGTVGSGRGAAARGAASRGTAGRGASGSVPRSKTGATTQGASGSRSGRRGGLLSGGRSSGGSAGGSSNGAAPAQTRKPGPLARRRAHRQAHRELLKTLGVRRAPGPLRRAARRLNPKPQRNPATGNGGPVARKPLPRPRVADTIRGGGPNKTPTKPTQAPTPNPAPTAGSTTPQSRTASTTPGGSTMMERNTPAGGGSSSPMRAMLGIIENDLRRLAHNYTPVGMEEVLAEYERWPEVLHAIGKIWKIMGDRAEADYPLSPAAAQLVSAIRKHQHNTARAAEEIGPVIRSLHRRELEDLEDRRKAMWDHRANPNTAGKP